MTGPAAAPGHAPCRRHRRSATGWAAGTAASGTAAAAGLITTAATITAPTVIAPVTAVVAIILTAVTSRRLAAVLDATPGCPDCTPVRHPPATITSHHCLPKETPHYG